MFRPIIISVLIVFLMPRLASAQERDFTLSMPQILNDSGVLQFLLPRFSLKTGVRADVQIDAPQAEMVFNSDAGILVMDGLDMQWFITLNDAGNERSQKAKRFADWLVSEVGRRTIEQFSASGDVIFVAAQAEEIAEIEMVFQGDLTRGEELSFINCARCHVIGTRNLMKGIGSTPSFGLLRGFPDWQERFMTFYARAPHPAITQIEGITEPFDPSRPPTIEPLLLTVDQLEDILTFVATVTPVDLGAPLVEHQ